MAAAQPPGGGFNPGTAPNPNNQPTSWGGDAQLLANLYDEQQWRSELPSNFLSAQDAANAEKALEQEEEEKSQAMALGLVPINRLPIAEYGDFGDATPPTVLPYQARLIGPSSAGKKTAKLIVKKPVIPFKAVPAVPGRPVIPEAEIAAVVIAQRERSSSLRQSGNADLMYL